MELIEQSNEKLVFTAKMNESLANAIRRSVSEVAVIAIEECDIYTNDSALYDEVVAHRLGLVPLHNQKLKTGETITLKLKAKGKEGGTYVLSGELGDATVYENMPIVFLEKGQNLEIVARAGSGQGKDHAKFMPGIMFYRHVPKIKITKEGEAQAELAVLYPEVFTFDTKLKVVDETKCVLDEQDMTAYPGVDISFDDTLVFHVESWGQMPAKDIFVEACKVLKGNIAQLGKALK